MRRRSRDNNSRPLLPAQLESTAAPLSRHGSGTRRLRSVLSGVFAVMFVTASATLLYPLMPELQYRVGHVVAPTEGSAVLAGALPTSAAAANPSGNRVIIPKIGVTTAILEAPTLDILNEKEGVWHQTGDISNGNFVLAGHRFKYLPPNTSTLYNLNKVQSGDTVIVDWGGKRYVYVVNEVKTVAATAVAILDKGPSSKLTIYTCNDVRQTQRVVVVAAPLQ